MNKEALEIIDFLIRNGYDNNNVTIVTQKSVLHDIFEQEERNSLIPVLPGVYIYNEKIYDLDRNQLIEPDGQYSDVYGNTIYFYDILNY